MQKLVSIIVTSYNHADYLDQRMESIFNQTYGAIEIIVVDDCSTDNSRDVLEKFRDRKATRIVFSEKNQGYAAACNKGVALSRGDFIMFAECDDFCDPTQVETLMAFMNHKQGIGVAFSRSNMVDRNGGVFGTDFDYREKAFRDKCQKDAMIKSEDMQRFFLIHCVVPNMSSALIRKSVYESIGGMDTQYRVCADWDFWCRISKACDFAYTVKTLNNFRTHPTTVRSTSGVDVSMNEILHLLSKAEVDVPMSRWRQFYVRCNMGLIWSNYLAVNPQGWFKSFTKVSKTFLRYSRFAIGYLFIGFLIKIKTSVAARIQP